MYVVLRIIGAVMVGLGILYELTQCVKLARSGGAARRSLGAGVMALGGAVWMMYGMHPAVYGARILPELGIGAGLVLIGEMLSRKHATAPPRA